MEFLSIYILLTPVWLVFILQYVSSPVFMTVCILVNKLDNCFVVHLLELAMKRCFTGDLCSFIFIFIYYIYTVIQYYVFASSGMLKVADLWSKLLIPCEYQNIRHPKSKYQTCEFLPKKPNSYVFSKPRNLCSLVCIFNFED